MPTATSVPAPTATAVPTAAPTAAPTPEPVALTDEEQTSAYVQAAIEYYQANGLDATAQFYSSRASVADGRALTLIDQVEATVLVSPIFPTLIGQSVGQGSRYATLAKLTSQATQDGYWLTAQGFNPTTQQEEPRRIYGVLHDGLVFVTAHSALVDDVAASVQEYVDKAIAVYDSQGLEATIARYNSADSVDGQLYLFLIGADDNYLAHPIFPHLIGTDIKDVVGSDGQELGEEIAQATEEGVWVEYLWPHPTTRVERQKATWAIRHDGLIFASGYYGGGAERGEPAWRDADPMEYTVEYVNRAVQRYERDGLQSFLNYYNSVASFEGEWYLFATDADDIYHVHPLLPRLIGTDIKDVVGSDGYRLGEELAKSGEGEGVWVEYLWPHPVTLKEAPKVGYAVRKDGMIFASGYYERIADPAARTIEYVQGAIDHYRDNGLDATADFYNDQDSLDGQWGLLMADENDLLIAAPLAPHLLGSDLKSVSRVGEQLASATEEGGWFTYIFPNTRSSEKLYAHTYAIRFDGLLFSSRYYDDNSENPTATQDELQTRAYALAAVDYYKANGLDATISRYSSHASIENGRTLNLIRKENATLLASVESDIVGVSVGSGSPLGDFSSLIEGADEDGYWETGVDLNPATRLQGPRRIFAALHDGLVFTSSHTAPVEDLADTTRNYVNRAIAMHDAQGLDATIAYYNSQESVEGQFYLFLIGADDNYLVHPIFKHLIGTGIKDVVGSDGQELGKEIAEATTEGVWVEYLWPHPSTRIEQPKVTWAVRHAGADIRVRLHYRRVRHRNSAVARRRSRGVHRRVREPRRRILRDQRPGGVPRLLQQRRQLRG